MYFHGKCLMSEVNFEPMMTNAITKGLSARGSLWSNFFVFPFSSVTPPLNRYLDQSRKIKFVRKSLTIQQPQRWNVAAGNWPRGRFIISLHFTPVILNERFIFHKHSFSSSSFRNSLSDKLHNLARFWLRRNIQSAKSYQYIDWYRRRRTLTVSRQTVALHEKWFFKLVISAKQKKNERKMKQHEPYNIDKVFR